MLLDDEVFDVGVRMSISLDVSTDLKKKSIETS